jgi:outer membrane lipoprotein SlyB
MKTKIILAMLLALQGCAVHQPVIDMLNVDPVAYDRDMAECTAYAGRIDPGASTANNAVAGAIIGAVIGAIFCGRNCAAQVGASTAVYGAASGASGAANAQRSIVNNCMAGRGYKVLY